MCAVDVWYRFGALFGARVRGVQYLKIMLNTTDHGQHTLQARAHLPRPQVCARWRPAHAGQPCAALNCRFFGLFCLRCFGRLPDSSIWSRFASAFESVPSGPSLRVFSLPERPGGASKSRLRREIAASERAPGSSGLGGGVVWRRPHLALGGPRSEKSVTELTDE